MQTGRLFSVTCFLIINAFPACELGQQSSSDSHPSPEPIIDLPVTRDVPGQTVDDSPSETETSEEYANGLLVRTDCPAEDGVIITGKPSSRDCGYITIIPYLDDDGDVFEVAAPFAWTLDDAETFQLAFPLGETNNYIRVLNSEEPLDEEGNEQTTILHACVQNACPTPRPEDCADELCVELPLIAIADVRGMWVFTSFQHEETLVRMKQIGRTFHSLDGYDVKDGFIEDSELTFQSGDYQYDGVLSSDGNSMSGTITDLIGLHPAGFWSAVRME